MPIQPYARAFQNQTLDYLASEFATHLGMKPTGPTTPARYELKGYVPGDPNFEKLTTFNRLVLLQDQTQGRETLRINSQKTILEASHLQVPPRSIEISSHSSDPRSEPETLDLHLGDKKATFSLRGANREKILKEIKKHLLTYHPDPMIGRPKEPSQN